MACLHLSGCLKAKAPSKSSNRSVRTASGHAKKNHKLYTGELDHPLQHTEVIDVLV